MFPTRFTVLSLLVMMAAAVEQSPQIGNGYILTFLNTTDVFIAGVFNGAGSNSQRAVFPPTTRVFAAGAESSIEGFELSRTDATVSLSFNRSDVFVKHEWYAHRTLRNLFIEEIRVTAKTSGNTSVPLLDLGITGADPNDYSGTTVINTTLVKIQGDAITANVTLYRTVVTEVPFLGQVSVCCAAAVPSASIQVNLSTSYLMLVTSYCTDAPSDEGASGNPCACAVAKLEYAYTNAKGLKAAHNVAWQELWSHKVQFTATEGSNLDTTTTLPNASVLQVVVDLSFYALLSSLRSDSPYSTGPGGLTNGYRGHTFWDMETWIMPNMLLFYPEIAKGSAMSYRLNRLDGAADNAIRVAGGTTGYAFPWESAFSGFTVCPWPQGASSELHITADIVGGWRLYYFISGDVDFLRRTFEAINGTAAFWLSRATKDALTGQWHINNVIPPDEYHFGNDSTYTNFAVRSVVNFTLVAAQRLNISLSMSYAASLKDFHDHIVILYNKTGNYHPEFAGYSGDKIKQADVVMLNYPWGMEMEASTVKSDLDFYAARMDPANPVAMTWSMFAVGYFSIKETDVAMEYFLKGFENNTFPPFYEWYEAAGGAGCRGRFPQCYSNFITGAGGFLQSIWAGLGGLRFQETKLIITTAAYLPLTIGEMRLQNIYFQDSQLSIRLFRGQNSTFLNVGLRLEQSGRTPLTVNDVPLRIGSEVVIVLSSTVIITTQS